MRNRNSASHTWKMNLHYHSCPSCGFVIEDRQPFQYRQGKYFKHLECPRCDHKFKEYQDRELRIGPIFGEETPPEFDWD